MKKSLAAFLSIIMIFALTACGSKTDSKWNYTKEDSAFFYEAFSDKALNQDDSGIDIIYVHDVELDENISEEDVLVFNYDELEEDENYEYVSYDLIKKYQIKTEKTEITHEPDRFLVYFYGGDDLFTNYGVLISKDVTADREYIITKTQKEYLGGENEYTGLKNLTFAPLFSYLDAHGVTMEKIIEDGVMLGPEVGLFTVNHEPKNIRVIMTKEIHIKKNAWIGARVNILPGVTIGENAIIGTG